MKSDSGQQLGGGCQCGRVRYRVTPNNDEAYLCHCRMCQRATGGFAAAFVNVKQANLVWESAPDWYQSSPIARRPFCSACGTPLGFQFVEGENCDLTLGSFDDPKTFKPTSHFGAESIVSEAWLDTHELKRMRCDDHQPLVDKWIASGTPMPD